MMGILDIIALACAIIATGLAYSTSRMLRSLPMQIVTLACLYGIVIRTIVVLDYENIIDCHADMSTAIAAVFWIILVLGLIGLWKTVNNLMKHK